MIFVECNNNDDDDDHDDTDDLGNIRRTCKDFDSLVAPILASRWSGDLHIYLSRPSVKAYGTMSSAFASQVQTIRLCNLRHNGILKPDLRARSRDQRLRRQEIMRATGWGDGAYVSHRDKLLKDIDTHNGRVAKQNQHLLTGGPLKYLLHILQRLMTCNNNDVHFEIYDNPYEYPVKFAERLGVFGIKSAHKTHDTSSIVQVLGHAIKSSHYPLKSITLMTYRGVRPVNNIRIADIFWDNLPSIPEFSIELHYRTEETDHDWLDSISKILNISANGTRLQMKDQNYRPASDGGPDLWLSRSNYGALYDYVRNKQFHAVELRDIEAHHDFLKSGLNLRSEKLKSLELCRVRFTRSFSESGWLGTALIFLRHLKKMTELESLELCDISDEKHDTIQEDRVHWVGQEEIQEGLDGLIRKVSDWYI